MRKILICALFLSAFFTYAQTELDAIMMSKKNLCIGTMYQHSSWSEYWEGTFKRKNLNFGTVSTQTIGVMGNYGILDNLNFLFSASYLKTKASAGTMMGQEGFQDFSVTLKYMPIEKSIGKSTYSLYGLASYSAPISNYTLDYLPLAIGSGSQVGTFRIMGDYQRRKFFTTVSAAYLFRSTILIDRNSYYTTEMHYTNEVDMPDVFSFNARMGYRSNRLIAEAVLDNWVSQSGFDITKNNMPFPSNTMNATRLGANAKYTFTKLPALSIIAGYNYGVDGRNVGQSNSCYGGAFYVLNFNKTVQDEK